jgi:hypothetical protein
MKSWLLAIILTFIYLIISHLLFVNHVFGLTENSFSNTLELILTFPTIFAFGLGFHEGISTFVTYVICFPFIWIVFFGIIKIIGKLRNNMA